MLWGMAIGVAQRQVEFLDAAVVLGDALDAGSIYGFLAGHGHRLFGDDYFADLFVDTRRGRPTIPARVMAVTMLLQSFEGLSDREAVDRLRFDVRWRAAAGLTVEPVAFHPTVLVGLRNRLRASGRPRRLFTDTRELAKATGRVVARVRVLDSTPLLDAVATQDTVTQLRAAVRKLLRSLPPRLAEAVRGVLARDDDYVAAGKPPCDWDDPQARAALVDALVRDCLAALAAVEGQVLEGQARDDADLLAVVAGQDVEQHDDGVFRIARGTAKDRVISTVDPQARHGHKSRARSFDGYKTHIAVDPVSEIVTEVAVTAANTADRDAVDTLIAELHHDHDHDHEGGGGSPVVIGDSAYADAATLDRLTDAGVEVVAKVPPARNTAGGFTKDAFTVDLDAKTVTCPNQATVRIRYAPDGSGVARFGSHCHTCPLRSGCTRSPRGRAVAINPHERALQTAKARQQDPVWQQTYRTLRPIVERKIAHLVRAVRGGRKARCRGTERVATDLDTRAGVVNLARLATLGTTWTATGWAPA